MVILKEIVKKLELGDRRSVTVEELAQSHGIKRRGLYDFLSICSALGVCRRSVNNNVVEWLGLQQADWIIASLRNQASSDRHFDDLFPLFDCSDDPSLHRITEAVLRLFFSLGIQLLDLRKVAKLFAQGKTKYKTMLRKLYTVVCGLELAAIVSRTDKVSEIRLNGAIPLRSPASQFSILSILNSP
jgi:hypothetical protein